MIMLHTTFTNVLILIIRDRIYRGFKNNFLVFDDECQHSSAFA